MFCAAWSIQPRFCCLRGFSALACTRLRNDCAGIFPVSRFRVFSVVYRTGAGEQRTGEGNIFNGANAGSFEMSINIHIIIPNGLSPLNGCLFAAEELKRRAKKHGYPLDVPRDPEAPHQYVVRLLSFDSKRRRVSYHIEDFEEGAI